MSKLSEALKKLQIQKDHKRILSLDGGGIRGIMTLQLLIRLEEVAGIPCYELFNMIVGTSTGGIIAGLIACGKSARQILDSYKKLVKKVFKVRNFTAHRFLNPPRYCKENYRSNLETLIGKKTTLADACNKNKIDLMITAKDVAAGEETFFSCFYQNNGQCFGTYSAVLLRTVLEATMSAPTYFTPFERFIDGGVTTYNNPALAAIMEAVKYGPPNRYQLDKLTIFSFGTGCRPIFAKVDDITNPKGIDAYFWLNYLMSEAGDDASDMQNYFLRSRLIKGLDFRRFQISLDAEAMKKLPDRKIEHIDEVEANTISELTDEELSDIPLDKITLFPLMEQIGEAFADYIDQLAPAPFCKDLIDENGKELLVTRKGEIDRIKEQMSSAAWVKNLEL